MTHNTFYTLHCKIVSVHFAISTRTAEKCCTVFGYYFIVINPRHTHVKLPYESCDPCNSVKIPEFCLLRLYVYIVFFMFTFGFEKSAVRRFPAYTPRKGLFSRARPAITTYSVQEDRAKTHKYKRRLKIKIKVFFSSLTTKKKIVVKKKKTTVK